MDDELRRVVDRARRRSRRYWYEDGLAEIAFGAVFLSIGALFLAEALLPAETVPPNFSPLGLVVVVVGGGLIARWLVTLAKERLTYPRTGYVAYPRGGGTRRRAATVAVGAAVAVAVGSLLALAPESVEWIPLIQGGLIGGALLFWGHWLGLGRFYILAVCSLALGIAASLFGLGEVLGSAAYFAGLGGGLVLSGALTLRDYLRRTRPPEGG